MDGLSGAASVIAVVSLAVQLADVVKSVYDFWKSVDEVPDFVHEIVADLKLLSTTLAEIAQHEQKHGNNGSITDILESCTGHIQTMLRMTSQLEFGIQSKSLRKRKWSAIKAVFKEEKIAKFQQRLLNVKSTLLLARQTLSDRSVQLYFDQNGRTLAAIVETLREQNKQTSEILATFETTNGFAPEEALEEQWEKAAAHITSPYIKSGFKKALDIAIKQTQKEFEQDTVIGRDAGADISVIPSLQRGSKRWRFLTSYNSSTTKTIFGDITIHTNTYRIINKKINEYNPLDYATETKTRIIFCPSTWLQRFGIAYELQFELSRFLRSWKTALQVLQPVPDDSLIFQFCHSGNIQGVQTLFLRKEASVWDTNSRGWTPLHVAAHTCQVQLIRFLLSEGADPDVTTHDQLSCLDIVTGSGFRTPETQLKVDGITANDRARLDVWPYFLYQQDVHESAIDNELFECGFPDCPCGSDDAFQGQLENYSDEQIKCLFSETVNVHVSVDMQEALSRYFLLAAEYLSRSSLEWLVSTHKFLVDARWLVDGYTPIIKCVAIRNWVAVQALARNGANLHLIGKDTDYSPQAESATSISLYNSTSFVKWRHILRNLAIDITAFIEIELKHDRLRQDGWSTETLRILFDLEFSPVPFEKYCQICSWQSPYKTLVETSWQALLERIKKGESLAGYIDKYSKFRDLDTDDQESDEDLDQEIIEISSDEDSENEETSDDESEIPEGEGDIEDEQDDAHEERSCTDQNDSTFSDYESDDEWEGKPEWMCASCWYKKKDDTPPTTAYDVPVSEDDSSEYESPMPLDIDI